jgi:drug/metabolite transporter (DMT)-like permease
LVVLAPLPTLVSVIANLEPVVATLLAFLILGEVMTGWQIVDSALVITGAVIGIQS